MSLAQEDIEFIKQHLGEWLTEVSLGKPPAVYEIELRERMVRVEEALKHQGGLIQQLIQQMEELQRVVRARSGGSSRDLPPGYAASAATSARACCSRCRAVLRCSSASRSRDHAALGLVLL